MDETATLAELVKETDLDDVSPEAVAHAKRSIRDFVGVAMYGSQHEVGSTLMSYVDEFASAGDAVVFGHGTSDAPHAALANGTFGHAVDFDDTFESVVIHPSGSAFPAALAAADRDDKSGRDVLTGYIVGLEAAYRIGRSVSPSHWTKGWHSTGSVGVFGATAAASSVLDLSVEAIQRAFGIAGSSASGMQKNAGTMTKPLHAGHAATMGIRAALLSQKGFTSNPSILGGENGYGTLYTSEDGYSPYHITNPDHHGWAVLDNGFKPYPSGVVTHAPMEALRNIVSEHELTPEDVESVTVTMDRTVSEKLDSKEPRDGLSAKFSYEFCLAAVLREQTPGVHEFTDEYVRESDTRAAMEKIERDPVDNLFAESTEAEASYGARVKVRTKAGHEHVEEVRTAPGGPSNPLSDERLREKFTECVETVLNTEDTSHLWEIIGEMEEPGTLTELRELTKSGADV